MLPQSGVSGNRNQPLTKRAVLLLARALRAGGVTAAGGLGRPMKQSKREREAIMRRLLERDGWLARHAWPLMVLMLLFAPAVDASAPTPALAIDSGGGNEDMREMRLLMQKLRNLLASSKDIDDLEKMGLSRADANRMRRALKSKISAMTSDVIAAINRL